MSSTPFCVEKNKDNNNTDHILVIRLSAMGDIAMTIPVILQVTKKYPELKVTVLTKKFFEPIFEGLTNVSIYSAEIDTHHKGFFGLRRLATEIMDLGVTKVADLHNVIRSKIIKVFFKLNQIPVVQIDKGRAEKKALTRPENKIFEELKSTHQRYADVFKKLGYPIELKSSVFKQRPNISKEVLSYLPNSTKKWVGIAPFAQHEGKNYPLELMVKVIEKLNKLDNYELILFGGGKREADIFTNLESKFKNVTNFAGKVSFAEELTVISSLDIMLSMDSGNGHLAAMYGVPVVTLWGVTHPYLGFVPYAQPESHQILPNLARYDQIPTSVYGNKVPEGYEKIMHSITPDTVVNKLLEII